MVCAGYVTHKEDQKCIQNTFSNLEERRPLRRPGYRWENNIKMDPNETVLGGVDCIHVAQNRGQ
jgi:hypothetical protein